MSDPVYCVSCRPGDEQTLARLLQKRFDIPALCATWEHEEYREGEWVSLVDPLIKGYVFLYPAADCSELFMDIERIGKVNRILCYEDGEYALRGSDLEFARWVMKYNGQIGISEAILEDNKVVIVDGPLKDYEGVVKKVNKQSRFALVEVTVGDAVKNVWLGLRWMIRQDGALVRWQKQSKAAAQAAQDVYPAAI